MQSNILKHLFVFSVCFFVIFISSCHRNDPGSSACPGTVLASWKVDGTPYQSSSGYLTIYSPGVSFTITAVACVPSGTSDRSVSFEVFHDLAVGSYPIGWKMLHAQPPNGTAGADYLVTHGDNYFTDSVTNTGMLNIIAVNAASHTYSGTFQFTATNDAGTGTVHITDGTITNAGY